MMTLPLIVFSMALVLFVLLRNRKADTNREVEDMARRAVEKRLSADEELLSRPDGDKSDPTE